MDGSSEIVATKASAASTLAPMPNAPERPSVVAVAPTAATTRTAGRASGQLADAVAERIERLIVDGVLKTGQPLPSERRLVEKLGVSRTALREGLSVLRARGIIQTDHGKGSFVANLSGRAEASPLMYLLGAQPRTLYDLFEVRSLLETEAARLAALRGTPADHVMITRRYQEMLAAHEGNVPPSEHAQRDHAFHLAICEASHNSVLVHTLSALTDLMLCSVFACVNNLYHRDPYKRAIDAQHTRLYRAVIAKDPDEARQAAADHIASVCASLKEIEQEEQRLVRATLRLEGWR
ncbi:transcriptional regulator GlcC [Robbsia sp. KACC 23696]|uniref:transcriptional regulator GlcC n=1 Tax=Robbsia sp. KACC 23696 TaxID=3149231 RepID=UPI00325AFC49